jgi:hypothetical protein
MKPARKRCVLTEEILDETGDRLEYTIEITEMLAQETGTLMSSVATATILLKLRPYKVTVVNALQQHVPFNMT